MNEIKCQAIETMNELHRTIPYNDYCTVISGLQDIETLQDRDEELEDLWRQFGDVPINLDTEKTEEAFMEWPAGTEREEVWHWFDQRYSKGVAYLLYGGAEDYVHVTRQLYGLQKLCCECKAISCQFNHYGECRFALVHERKPRINDYDGWCIDAITRRDIE